MGWPHHKANERCVLSIVDRIERATRTQSPVLGTLKGSS
jgi:hypothetical protein